MAQNTVNLTFRFNDTEEKELRAALDGFEKQNPGIKVTLQRIGWRDARDQYLREAAVGQGPDVVHVAQVWVKEMGQAGALRPLNDLIKSAPPGSGFSDFMAQELAQGKDGQIYGLPWTTDTWAMVYRTDLLKEAGISKLPETWKELHDASAQVKQRTGKTGFGFPAGSSASGAIWFLANFYWWSNGKAMVVQNANGTYGMNLTAADIADSMRYFKSFITEGHNPVSNLSASDAHDPAILQALVTGQQGDGSDAAQHVQAGAGHVQEAHPGQPLPFVSAPFPKGSVTRTSMIGGRMLIINASSKHPQEAWKLVRYLATEPIFTTVLHHAVPGATVAVEERQLVTRAQGLRRATRIRAHLGTVFRRSRADRRHVERDGPCLQRGAVGTAHASRMRRRISCRRSTKLMKGSGQ